jgi:hypothetical protein
VNADECEAAIGRLVEVHPYNGEPFTAAIHSVDSAYPERDVVWVHEEAGRYPMHPDQLRLLPPTPSSGETEGQAGSGDELAAGLRAAVDWPGVVHELARQPVVYDAEIEQVAPDAGGWRGATPEEIERIVQVVTSQARLAQPTVPADDPAPVLAGLFGPEEIDATARALCAEWVETQLKEPVRKFCEYDQLTTEGRDVWRRMARRAISAAQQRLAERGQGRGEG